MGGKSDAKLFLTFDQDYRSHKHEWPPGWKPSRVIEISSGPNFRQLKVGMNR